MILRSWRWQCTLNNLTTLVWPMQLTISPSHIDAHAKHFRRKLIPFIALLTFQTKGAEPHVTQLHAAWAACSLNCSVAPPTGLQTTPYIYMKQIHMNPRYDGLDQQVSGFIMILPIILDPEYSFLLLFFLNYIMRLKKIGEYISIILTNLEAYRILLSYN